MSDNQGIRYIFSDGSRFVFRLSGASRWPAAVNIVHPQSSRLGAGRQLQAVRSNRSLHGNRPFVLNVAKVCSRTYRSNTGLQWTAGTGSSGATIRMYIEKYVSPEAGLDALSLDTAEAVAPLVKAALTASNLVKLTRRDKPTVIT